MRIYGLLIILLSAVITGCVQFKPMALYENEDQIVEPPSIGGLYALDIFKDEVNGDIWGLEKDPFKNHKANTEKTHNNSKVAIELFWDKSLDHTAWVGMGFGWDGWSGKDLEEIIDSAAVQFYMRAFNDDDTLKQVIIVFHFEDYANTQTSAVFIDMKYLQDTAKYMTKEWKKVLIPISEFNTQMDLINWGGIKQLLLQFETDGHVLIDDIEIVRYTPPIEAKEKS